MGGRDIHVPVSLGGPGEPRSVKLTQHRAGALGRWVMRRDYRPSCARKRCIERSKMTSPFSRSGGCLFSFLFSLLSPTPSLARGWGSLNICRLTERSKESPAVCNRPQEFGFPFIRSQEVESKQPTINQQHLPSAAQAETLTVTSSSPSRDTPAKL